MKSVAIIGCAAGWENAPTDCESWGITSLVLKRPVTHSFDMHDLTQNKADWIRHYTLWLGKYYGRNYINQRAEDRIRRIPEQFAEINRLGIPLYSVRTYSQVPTSTIYPLREVKSVFKPAPFSGTFDYLAALALFNEYEKIDIYGVQMDSTGEYVHQLMSANYWLGRCIEAGIEVKVHGDSLLLSTINGSDYGYKEDNHAREK